MTANSISTPSAMRPLIFSCSRVRLKGSSVGGKASSREADSAVKLRHHQSGLALRLEPSRSPDEQLPKRLILVLDQHLAAVVRGFLKKRLGGNRIANDL